MGSRRSDAHHHVEARAHQEGSGPHARREGSGPPARQEASGPRARREGSGIFFRALALRGCLFELTEALARAEWEQVVVLDVFSGRVTVGSPLDGAPERSHVVARPDGLWEWRVRRDFVRAIRRERRKDADRLAATLGGPRSRHRFILALASVGDASLVRAFDLHRRRQLRAWAGRVLRAALLL